MSYPASIESIAHVHPILTDNPRIVNHAALNGVFSSKNAGDPLDNQALLDADQTVKSLKSAQTLMPDLISNGIVQSSKTRLHAMRSAHAAHEFQEVATLAQLLALVQDNHDAVIARLDQLDDRLNRFDDRLNRIDDRLREQAAYVRNTRIINKNRSQPTAPPTPLVKMIAGDGHDLAQTIFSQPALPSGVRDYHPEGAIGTSFPNFNPNIDSYSHVDILKLVVFYNDTFGIIQADAVHERKIKIRNSFAEYMV